MCLEILREVRSSAKRACLKICIKFKVDMPINNSTLHIFFFPDCLYTYVLYLLITPTLSYLWCSLLIKHIKTNRRTSYLRYCFLKFLDFLSSLHSGPSVPAEVLLNMGYSSLWVEKLLHLLGSAVWCQVVNSGLVITCPVALLVGY